ncbi:hypothetical protein OEA41_007695 [Lepraria neglecta]|uniref:Rhodopsin domain-containing protein n=1 Tax=Lepraria neglecta TaxID=209136 RepID=A0AAD9ZDL3_9LECA|nr:hypothetical protein OEA41_007695 [Lepraria neglecta]
MLTSASVAMIATQAILMAVAIMAVFSMALAVTNIVGVPVGGFGVRFEDLSEDTATQFFKILFVLQFWYIIAVAFVKLSVLYFYGRIFSVGRFPIIVKIMTVVVVAWLISFLFATFFQVWPLWCNWIVCVASTNYPVMYVVCSVTDIVLDITILALPAFFIRQLQMNFNKKIGVCGIFGLGIFCIIASIARLAYTADYLALNPINYGPSTNNAEVNIILWSGIEACASTICANLPLYSPFITRSRNLETIVSSFRSKFFFGTSNSSYRSHKNSRNAQMSSSSENIVKPAAAVETHIEGGMHRHMPESELEMGTINVRTTVDT